MNRELLNSDKNEKNILPESTELLTEIRSEAEGDISESDDSKVFIRSACGDTAVGGSIKVFAVGRPIHREADLTSGHGSWTPNAAGVSTNKKVFVGG